MLAACVYVQLILAFFAQVIAGSQVRFKAGSFTRNELLQYRREVKELFYFGFDNYLGKAFPYDELRPITCVAKTRNFTDSQDFATNDVLGNFSATFIDSLTTLAVFGDADRFSQAVDTVKQRVSLDFAIPSTIQVFETTIRILGGLLSAHLYATDPRKKVYLGDKYDGFLLERARALADRLIPAYYTSSGLPLARINLRDRFEGLSPEILDENNAAAIACPMLEFTVLSYLTLDEKYHRVTRYALDKIWSQRSLLNLMPMSFDPVKMTSYNRMTGIGASIDSFYEYALKGAILFDDEELFQIWDKSYYALHVHAKGDWLYANVNVDWGQAVSTWIDSLGAFFPGLQVLAGDVQDAQYKHLMFLKLWNTFGGIPERWNFQLPRDDSDPETKTTDQKLRASIPLEWYPLRPEFIESTYFLYRATRDPFYLQVGRTILDDLKTRFKSNCGFAGIQDVVTGKLQDRMETFVLSETLKYLYLLFDDDNEMHHGSEAVIFSTEAHPLWLTREMRHAYQSHGYLNDTIFKRYMRRWKPNDRNSPVMGFFRSIAKTLFSPEEAYENPEWPQSSVPDARIGRRVCPAAPKSSAGPLYSYMLTDFSRLFEIDNRYESTLIKPEWARTRTAMELEPGFYERWGCSRECRSRPRTSTEGFEMSFDRTLPGSMTKQFSTADDANGSEVYLRLNSLAGRHLLLERLRPRAVDSYGNYVEENMFQEPTLFDVHRPRACSHHASQSPALLYRITGVDGTSMPSNFTLLLDKNPTFTDGGTVDSIGYNAQNVILFNCVPVINALVQDIT
ncbi:LAMI_0C03400g1_1 [Lachancea mirantina]|uniref:alpha-1,2-Mannosidase n=1 Tax=Lachancea mirantina TaxID=1230905 RepID=A0A1G4J2A2_9SACH|nr:LAMI_0C03400g1_1 [Lachancea mirantina]